jgi:transcriptional regulator with XRE-family HTH domain
MSSRRPRLSKLLYAHQYEAFRRRLVEARTLAGLTQTEVAKRLGKTQTYVARCESGERRVDIVELVAFADVYRQKLAFFAPFKSGLKP